MKIILESVEEINESIEDWTGARTVHADKEIEMNLDGEVATYRKHAKSTKEKIPELTDVYPDGSLQMKTQKTNMYTMFDLLNLKSKIPEVNKYPSWQSLADAVKLNVNTCMRLSAGIELGYYDYLFIKWSNMSPKFDENGQLI